MVLKIDNNNLHVYGYIWDGDGAYFLEQFALLDGKFPTIEVWLHCYGGSVFDGNIIFNSLIKAESEVNTNVIGVGASMGAVLSQAGKVRRQVSNGFLMIHAASGYTHGNYQDHLNNANLLKEIEKHFKKMLIAKTGKTAKEVAKWLIGDNWFSAEQAKEAGLIDEIIDPLATLDIEIDDPEELGTEAVYSKFAASMKIIDKRPKGFVAPPKLERKKENHTKLKPVITMEQSSIEILGLSGVTPTSSETMIIQAVQAKFTALENKYQQEKTAKENLETAVNAQRDNKITALLDQAVTAKKITAQQKEVYENIGKTSGVEALEAVLAGLGARASITDTLIPGKQPTATVPEGWNWDRYQKEDPQALEKIKENTPETFNALYKAKFGKDFKED